MSMIRLAMQKLVAWKNKDGRKPLLLTGVRQCGKTYLLKEFGANEYKHTAYFNFDGDDRLKSVFDHDFNIDRIVSELESIILGKKISFDDTLVIFDEVQECPRAIHSLKYFYENRPEIHLVAAGSLLGVALTRGVSFPVGKVDRLNLCPMSFEEFVIAEGDAALIDGLKRLDLEHAITELYSIPMEKHLKNYFIIGGMPEVVNAWIKNHNYEEVEKLQENILLDYSDDFGKYTSPELTAKIRLVWNSLPVQIAKENNKFVFSHVKEGARAKELEDALTWLIDAGLASKLCYVEKPEIPLSAMADSTYFKLYMSDVGLLRKKSTIGFRVILDSNPLYDRYKGAFVENFVKTQLDSMEICSFFWRARANAEVDFITDKFGTVVPIEVKSSDNTKAKSLHFYCEKYLPEKALKLSMKNTGLFSDGKTMGRTIPLYMIFRLTDLLA